MAEILLGASAICEFVGFTESTLIDKVNREGFPAEKNDEGVFCAKTTDVNNWLGRTEGEKKIKAKSKTSVETKADAKVKSKSSAKKKA